MFVLDIQCLCWIFNVRLFDFFVFWIIVLNFQRLCWIFNYSCLMWLDIQLWWFGVVQYSTLLFLYMLNWKTSFFVCWIFNIAFETVGSLLIYFSTFCCCKKNVECEYLYCVSLHMRLFMKIWCLVLVQRFYIVFVC